MRVNLCNVYQDMVGVPGKGIRSYKIGSIIIVDLVVTILFSAAIYQIPYIHAHFNFRILTVLLLALVTLTHRLLCKEEPRKD